ncbi:MAG: hypothetical protein IKU81_05925 [Oscillibacter sp.]|nr:hypothetical protein [Oscillibacter sp.]
MKFACTYTPSEELLRQYHYRVKNSGVRSWLWVGAVLLVGSTIMFILTQQLLDLILLVLGLYLGYRELTAPGKNAKKEWAALLEKYDGKLPQITVTIDEEKAVLMKDDTETEIPLDDVLGLYFCKDSIVLHSFSKDILLAHEGLANIDEIKAFLRKHCQNAPVYK